MPLRKRKPTSPGRRFQTVSDFSEVTRRKPERGLLVAKPGTGGRNNYGRKTSRHRGGGHKQRYRVIDFKRDKDGVPAKVAAIEYDPNRNARIALLHYRDGEKRYILAPSQVRPGDVLQNGQGAEIRPGNALPLRYIPVGSTVHNVELKPGQGGKLARGAGMSTTSAGTKPWTATMVRAFATSPRWVWITALGTPLDPEVNRTAAGWDTSTAPPAAAGTRGGHAPSPGTRGTAPTSEAAGRSGAAITIDGST